MIKQLALATCIALCGVNVEAVESDGDYTLVISQGLSYHSATGISMVAVPVKGIENCISEGKKLVEAIGIKGFDIKYHCVKKHQKNLDTTTINN